MKGRLVKVRVLAFETELEVLCSLVLVLIRGVSGRVVDLRRERVR